MKIKKWFKLFNIVLLIQLIFISAVEVFSQGVAINTTGNAADNSAGLDVQFSDKGILIPRLTISQRNAIINPAEGLLIYNLDNSNNC